MTETQGILQRALDLGVFPGAACHFERERRVVWAQDVGYLGQESPFLSPVSSATLYDLASLTKIYTLAATLKILEAANLAPETTPVRAFLSGFDSRLTLEHLMNHSSGLATPLQSLEHFEAGEWVEKISTWEMQTTPGQVVNYNCTNYFLLARIAEKIAGQSLDQSIDHFLLGPLRLENTTFAPCDLDFVAPTERKTEHSFEYWHGEVHDEAARSWRRQAGTCAGNAGLFATAQDVARFGAIWLLDGQASPLPSVWRGRAILNVLPEKNYFRGWGWQRDAAFYMGRMSAAPGREILIGHLGFTGTSLVINPRRAEIAVVLSNRVHPTRSGPDRLPFVRALHERFWRSENDE